MRFSCTKENLSRGLNIVSRITAKNINLPILNNVLINIDNKNLKLQTTNLEIFVTAKIRSKIEEEGSFTAPSKLLSDYINLLPDERIDIEELENNFIKTECGSFKTKMKGLSSSEFPLTPEMTKDNSLECPVNDFKKLIEKVIFAVSPNETRPELSGVFLKFEIKDKKLTAAATDSYRLAEQSISIGDAKTDLNEKSIIVPAKTLQEIHRIVSLLTDLPESGKNLEIFFSDNQILFVYDNTEVFSRLIDGNYPEYQHIIPSGFKTSAVIDKEELIKAVKAASLFTKTNLNDVHLEFSAKGGETGELTVSSAESQIGENKISLNAEIEGEKNKIVLNYKYLNDGLNMIDSEKVMIQLNDDSTPCILGSAGKGQENYMYLIMPIKL